MSKIIGQFVQAGTLDGSNIQLKNAQTLKSTNAAGSGTVDLISASASNVITIPSLAQMVGTAVSGNDLMNYSSVTSRLASYLALSGGTMTGALNMGGQSLTGLVAPSLASDATTKSYVDSQVAATGTSASWQASVKDKVTAPPGSPATGDRYLVLPGGTGAFLTHDNQIAQWSGTAWVFTTAVTGTFVDVLTDVSSIYYFGGSTWTAKAFENNTAGAGIAISVGGVISVAPAGIVASMLATGSVTAPAIGAAAVGTAAIANSAITSALIASGAVGASQLGAQAVGSAALGSVITALGGLSGGAGASLAVVVDGVTVKVNGSGQLQSYTGGKDNFTLIAADITNQYVNLSHLVAANTINLFVSGVMQVEGVDYTVAPVGGVSRITFAGDLATGGPAALIVGNKINTQYMYL